MTIERFTFTPPLHIKDASTIKLDDALMFAKRREVPPGFKQDITPVGYRDQYVLRTTSSAIDGREDTVGEIEVTNKKSGGRQKSSIDEKTPIVVIARPNVLDGGDGIRIDEVIRYIQSIGARHTIDEQTAASAPIPWPFQNEAAEPIPVEIPHFDSTRK